MAAYGSSRGRRWTEFLGDLFQRLVDLPQSQGNHNQTYHRYQPSTGHEARPREMSAQRAMPAHSLVGRAVTLSAHVRTRLLWSSRVAHTRTRCRLLARWAVGVIQVPNRRDSFGQGHRSSWRRGWSGGCPRRIDRRSNWRLAQQADDAQQKQDAGEGGDGSEHGVHYLRGRLKQRPYKELNPKSRRKFRPKHLPPVLNRRSENAETILSVSSSTPASAGSGCGAEA